MLLCFCAKKTTTVSPNTYINGTISHLAKTADRRNRASFIPNQRIVISNHCLKFVDKFYFFSDCDIFKTEDIGRFVKFKNCFI